MSVMHAHDLCKHSEDYVRLQECHQSSSYRKRKRSIVSVSGAPLKQDVQDVRVLMHKSHSWAISIAVHAEDAPTHLHHACSHHQSFKAQNAYVAVTTIQGTKIQGTTI